jgi:hypothetical protein
MILNLPNTGIIGLYLSGGIESSLLLYLLSMQYSEREIKACILIKPSRIKLSSVENVLDWVEVNTGKGAIREDIFPDIKWNPSKVIVNWGNMLLRSKTIDMLITGGNDYPLDELENMPVRQYMSGNNVYHPFRGMLKTEILEIYKRENITDLLHLTHSCFDDMERHCMTCVNCRERIWAFKKLNMEDLAA